MRYIIVSLLVSVTVAASAYADRPAPEEFREAIPMEEPVAVQPVHCGWGSRVAVGVPVHFFDDEDSAVMPGLYFDFFPCETPINLRLGVEGIHMSLEQDGAGAYAEWDDKKTSISYFRIPMSVEYVTSIADRTSLYLGGGPDLIRTANDLSDFTVGMHLSGRLGYELNDKWMLAVEAGYQWAEVSDSGPDINLDGAFVSPTIGYRF